MGKVLIDDNRWFDDDGLVRFKNGGINWGANIGVPIEFQFYNYHGYYTIKRMISAKDKWYRYEYVICFDGDDTNTEYIVNKEILRTVRFSRLNLPDAWHISRKLSKSHAFLYDIGDIVNNQFLILERSRKRLYSSNKHEMKAYRCQCLLDGYIFETSEHNLKRMKKCWVCKGRVVIKGINDIATKRPEIAKFLKNKDDAYKYAAKSQFDLEFVCDVCGREFITSPYKFSYNFPCKCYSSDSYPNRLIQEIFNQLEIPYIRELNKKHFSWCLNYRYDLYFEINNSAYIIEMDGAMHKGEQLEIDKIKDNLAIANGVEVIRIDCVYPKVENRLSYIKNNLLESKLSLIVGLSKINWDVIDSKLLDENTTKKICDLRNQGLPYKDIANMLQVSRKTIDYHIKIGKDNGILNEWASSNFHRKEVFEITNLDSGEIQYCIGVHKFFKDANMYIGRTLSYGYFKKHSTDGYLVLNGYGIRKISYYDYLVKTADM